MKKIIVYSDGGARGNPGPAGIGVYVTDETGNVIKEVFEYIGESTNNIAEYTAVLRGLETLKVMFGESIKDIKIEWKLDSELVQKQLAGEYKVKNPGLRSIFDNIQDLRAHFPHLNIQHVRREFNKEADRLVNQAIDSAVA